MDGRNSSGRKISLLNFDSSSSSSSGDVAPIPTKPTAAVARPLQHHHQLFQPPQQQNTLPPLFSTHSRASSASCTSTPCLSPPATPQLVRSDSSDSRGFASPSPLTPSYSSFEQAHHQQQQHHRHLHHASAHNRSPSLSTSSYHQLPQIRAPKSSAHLYFANSRSVSSAKMDETIASLYPPIPDATGMMSSAYPMQPQIAQLPLQQDPGTLYRSSNSPASEPSRVSTVSGTSTNTTAKAAVPKKNQYPCPMAKQFNCTDFFTTSGHAARHAKKHTGKKDAFCPECNKAFTRKDNMEQHRRTHKNGRGVGRAADDKVKKSTKTPAKKTPSVKSEPALEAAVEQQLAQQQRQEEQQQHVAAQLQAVAQAQVAVAQQQQHLQAVEAALLNPGQSGPYFLSGIDAGPIPALPMPTMSDMSMRPQLHRSNLTSSLDYIPPLLGPLDPETLNYSYPSPGLSNGLNSLALAASEHRRLSEEKARTPPSDSNGTPPSESP